MPCLPNIPLMLPAKATGFLNPDEYDQKFNNIPMLGVDMQSFKNIIFKHLGIPNYLISIDPIELNPIEKEIFQPRIPWINDDGIKYYRLKKINL